jgi:hypothetical protein
MRQNDINFINILNRFLTTSQTFEDIDFVNKICFKTPAMDNTLPYLFYTNATRNVSLVNQMLSLHFE